MSKYKYCVHCDGNMFHLVELTDVVTGKKTGDFVCINCIDNTNDFFECNQCEHTYEKDEETISISEYGYIGYDFVCSQKCLEKHKKIVCTGCREVHLKSESYLRKSDNNYFCDGCAIEKNGFHTCIKCYHVVEGRLQNNLCKNCTLEKAKKSAPSLEQIMKLEAESLVKNKTVQFVDIQNKKYFKFLVFAKQTSDKAYKVENIAGQQTATFTINDTFKLLIFKSSVYLVNVKTNGLERIYSQTMGKETTSLKYLQSKLSNQPATLIHNLSALYDGRRKL